MKKILKNLFVVIVMSISLMCLFSCSDSGKKTVKGLNGSYIIENITIDSNDKKISGKLYLPLKNDKSKIVIFSNDVNKN